MSDTKQVANPDFSDCCNGYQIVARAAELWDGEESIADAVTECFNCAEAEVKNDGSIWIANPQQGHWLTDDETSSFVGFMLDRRMI